MRNKLDELTAVSHRALASALAEARARCGEAVFAVDATMGNGHDTLFLASAMHEKGRIFAFDVQEAALDATKLRLEKRGLAKNVSFMLAGHETALTVLPPGISGNLWAVTFNLGFLPRSDRRIMTKPATTLAALDVFASLMASGGILSVQAYAGHQGGEEEYEAVSSWFRELPWQIWHVSAYSFVNKPRNREILFLAQRCSGEEG